jgi:hypothetical protein
MKVGYIRVSKQEQNEILQSDALKEAGCEKYTPYTPNTPTRQPPLIQGIFPYQTKSRRTTEASGEQQPSLTQPHGDRW